MQFHIAREAAAAAFNDAHDYPRAIELLQEALHLEPGDKDTLDTLEIVKSEQARAPLRAAISAGVAALTDTVDARSAPTVVSGLDFTSADPAVTPVDPSVVDARAVPTGLPASVAAEIPDTDAGNRVRKGFQAIVAHDWPVALAWFQDAANHEPGNPGLERLIDLAKDGVSRTTSGTGGPLPIQQPASTSPATPMSAEDASMNAEIANELDRFNSGHPLEPGWLGKASLPPASGADRTPPVPPPNWGAFFDAIFGSATLSRLPLSVAGVRG